MAEIRAQFNLNPGDVQKALTGADAKPRADMLALGRRIVANAQQRCPVKTGTLRRSIGMDFGVAGTQMTLGIFAKARHASFVEQGTRPHAIMPKRARVLRFQAGGRTVFAARVNHSGTRPRPFLRPAIEEEIRRL